MTPGITFSKFGVGCKSERPTLWDDLEEALQKQGKSLHLHMHSYTPIPMPMLCHSFAKEPFTSHLRDDILETQQERDTKDHERRTTQEG